VLVFTKSKTEQVETSTVKKRMLKVATNAYPDFTRK